MRRKTAVVSIIAAIMCISYDFDGDVEDLSRYDDRIKELDEQFQ